MNGITCSSVFQTLTSFEHKLIVLSYIEKKTDSEIAEIYGLCRITINRKMQAAIKKILNVNSDKSKKE